MITGQIKRGGSLTGSVRQSGSLAPEIFWVTYGTTTAEEIAQAIAEQKVCVMSRDNSFYYLIRYTATEYFFIAFDTVNEKIKYYRFYNNGWYYNTVSYQEALTFDTAPNQYSNNPVRSYGIWNAIKAVSDTVHSLPAGGTQGQVLKKSSDTDYEAEWADDSGSGSSDYTELTNKPSINGVTLYGNKTSTNLGLASASDLDGKIDNPSGGTVGQVLKKTASGAEWADESGGGSSPSPASATPLMDGTAAVGSSAAYARGDHVHPTDTSRAAASDLAAKADKVTEVTVSTAGAVTQALDAGKIYHFTGELTALTITLNAPASGQLAEYHFDFLSGATAPTLTMPNTVTMPDSFAVEANKRYEIDVLNNYGAVMAWAT